MCNHYAPVVDGWREAAGKSIVTIRWLKEKHLYAIAWQYGYDYRTLAKFNHY